MAQEGNKTEWNQKEQRFRLEAQEPVVSQQGFSANTQHGQDKMPHSG